MSTLTAILREYAAEMEDERIIRAGREPWKYLHEAADEIERLERERMPGAYFPPLHDKKRAE